MGINGRDLLRLTHYHEDAHPDWSSEGLLVFHSKREGDRVSRIYTVGTWIGAQDQVLKRSDISVLGDSPAWLGTERIVYNLCAAEGCALHIMRKDGSEPIFFFKDNDRVVPFASPDGNRVAFSSGRDGNWEIYTLTVQGGQLNRLTDDPADDWMPAWSPDGQYIAFVSNRDGDWALWAMRADGSSQTRLFSLEGIPDGRVRDAPDYTSVGWSEERISWAP